MAEEPSGSGINRSRRYFKQSNPIWIPKVCYYSNIRLYNVLLFCFMFYTYFINLTIYFINFFALVNTWRICYNLLPGLVIFLILKFMAIQLKVIFK